MLSIARGTTDNTFLVNASDTETDSDIVVLGVKDEESSHFPVTEALASASLVNPAHVVPPSAPVFTRIGS